MKVSVDKMLQEREQCIARVAQIDSALAARGIAVRKARSTGGNVAASVLGHLTANPGASVAEVATAVYGSAEPRNIARTRCWMSNLANAGKLRRESKGVWVPT